MKYEVWLLNKKAVYEKNFKTTLQSNASLLLPHTFPLVVSIGQGKARSVLLKEPVVPLPIFGKRSKSLGAKSDV